MAEFDGSHLKLKKRLRLQKDPIEVSDAPSQNRPEPKTELLQKLRYSWQPGEWSSLNVAVALSGGADSVSLLRSLWQLKQLEGGAGDLIAIHVNHQLRGDDSQQDALWCQQLCDSLGVPLKVLLCDTAQRAAETGLGIEAAARAERYQLLTSTAEELGVRYLATAHTSDDQVETILFRILRGTGLRGLSGIPRTRALTPSLTLIRPLLDCSRAMVLDYLAAFNQSFRTDKSNADGQFTRNRLRHQLLPQLREQYNLELDAALLRLASQASNAQQMLESQARELLETAQLSIDSSTTPRSLSFDCHGFANQDRAILCEAIRLAWREAGLAEQAMTHQWWNRLADLLDHPQETTILNLPGNVRASIAGGQLLLNW